MTVDYVLPLGNHLDIVDWVHEPTLIIDHMLSSIYIIMLCVWKHE